MRYTVVMGGFVLICAGFLCAAALLMLRTPDPPSPTLEWHSSTPASYYTQRFTPYSVLAVQNDPAAREK